MLLVGNYKLQSDVKWRKKFKDKVWELKWFILIKGKVPIKEVITFYCRSMIGTPYKTNIDPFGHKSDVPKKEEYFSFSVVWRSYP